MEFRDEDLCFIGPHSRIRSVKVFVPPKFVYVPQSRYPGPGPENPFVLLLCFYASNILQYY